MKTLKYKILILLLFLSFQNIYTQDIDETDINELAKNNYNDLSEYFQLRIKDSTKVRVYAQAFLAKAKQESNTIKKADGYYMLATVSEHEEALLYCDSIIEVTKNEDHYSYPAKAHLLKAQILGSQSEYQKTMDELVKANIYANKNENIDQKYKTKYFIAILKNNLGEYEESLDILKSTTEYYKNKYDEDKNYEYDYIKSLYAYGNAYDVNNKYDSAYTINKKAIKLSLKSKDSTLYGRLLLTSAVTLYHKKQYQASLDSINRLKEISNYRAQSKGTLIRTDLYLGKIYFVQNKFEKSIHHLKAVDSFAFSKQYFFINMREAYELLIKYYREQQETEKQIFYIDRLLKVDSILDNDYKYISRQINDEYSTPNLILEKQEIIDSLQKNNKSKIIFLIILSTLFLLLILVLIRNDKKKKTYKKRFLELLDHNKKPSLATSVIKPSKKIEKNESNNSDIGISEIIVNDILKSLKSFENNNDFLTPNLTVSSLSKKFKTNSKYLSKVINIHKNKSFSNYVNELRIDYVVEELKSNPKFRKYTIKAIANEIGFNTTEAFSKSFYKTTGIYPSFFLKQLEKQQDNSKIRETI